MVLINHTPFLKWRRFDGASTQKDRNQGKWQRNLFESICQQHHQQYYLEYDLFFKIGTRTQGYRDKNLLSFTNRYYINS